jgi:hypothetical protein
MPPPRLQLDYEPPSRQRTSAILFWSSYFGCALVGLCGVQPTVAYLLWGRPGDEVVAGFVLASAAAVTGVLAGFWDRIRALAPARGVLLATSAGLGCFLPAYAVLYIFF